MLSSQNHGIRVIKTTPQIRHNQNVALHTAINKLPADEIAALTHLIEELGSRRTMRSAVMMRGVKALTRIPFKPELLRRAIQASTDFVAWSL